MATERGAQFKPHKFRVKQLGPGNYVTCCGHDLQSVGKGHGWYSEADPDGIYGMHYSEIRGMAHEAHNERMRDLES